MLNDKSKEYISTIMGYFALNYKVVAKKEKHDMLVSFLAHDPG